MAELENRSSSPVNVPLLSKVDPAKKKARRALMLALFFTSIFMAGEVVGGYFANSLAIMTDAAHLLTDIGAMLLSLFAMWLAARPPTAEMTFGFHRAEILGALASVLTIWALTGVLIYEAILRILHPPDKVDGKLMFFVALGGLCINILDAVILHYGAGGHGHSHGLGGGGGHGHSHGGGNDHGSHKKKDKKEHKEGHEHKHKDKEHKHKEHKHKEKEFAGTSANIQGESSDHHDHDDHGHSHKDKKKKKDIKNINVYSAYIHVLGDCVQSVGVMAASGLIWWRPDWKLADPIVTFVFGALVLFTTVRLLRQSLSVLMEGVPQGLSQDEVTMDLLNLEDVEEVHDLHIWSLTVGSPSLSVHLTVGPDCDSHAVLIRANQMLNKNHGISHTTIQIEVVQVERAEACGNVVFHGGKHGGTKRRERGELSPPLSPFQSSTELSNPTQYGSNQ
eukprot:TRINITY_DN6067_c0_g1_i1.p1 TRINITY_DN6067_c0_g1~~TRINITY_DN6067_c0_g1_i1.p1  ORF type:complete len:449 (-),score=103.35 TRINITY_DN6067_c0_g1_i1:174-1520(-)